MMILTSTVIMMMIDADIDEYSNNDDNDIDDYDNDDDYCTVCTCGDLYYIFLSYRGFIPGFICAVVSQRILGKYSIHSYLGKAYKKL